jgi:hypothetical protein
MSATTSPKGEEGTERDPRKCEGERKDGSPCPSWKVRGKSLCSGHLGLGIAASPEAARAAQRQSVDVRQEQASAAKRRAVDVFREAVEVHAEAFVAAKVAIALDQNAPAGDRLRAMEQLESRALGKPKETVEHQDGKSAVDQALDAMTDDELVAASHLWLVE